jgi:hypothetical protein
METISSKEIFEKALKEQYGIDQDTQIIDLSSPDVPTERLPSGAKVAIIGIGHPRIQWRELLKQMLSDEEMEKVDIALAEPVRMFEPVFPEIPDFNFEYKCKECEEYIPPLEQISDAVWTRKGLKLLKRYPQPGRYPAYPRKRALNKLEDQKVNRYVKELTKDW